MFRSAKDVMKLFDCEMNAKGNAGRSIDGKVEERSNVTSYKDVRYVIISVQIHLLPFRTFPASIDHNT